MTVFRKNAGVTLSNQRRLKRGYLVARRLRRTVGHWRRQRRVGLLVGRSDLIGRRDLRLILRRFRKVRPRCAILLDDVLREWVQYRLPRLRFVSCKYMVERPIFADDND